MKVLCPRRALCSFVCILIPTEHKDPAVWETLYIFNERTLLHVLLDLSLVVIQTGIGSMLYKARLFD